MTMDFKDIKNDVCVKDFLRSRDLRESTKNGYILRIKSYSNFINKMPSEFIEEAEKEEEDGIKPRHRKVKGYLLDYVEDLESRNRQNLTIKSLLETVKSFYNHFDIDTPRIKRKKLNNTNFSLEKIPGKNHIRMALNVCGLRDKAIIYLMMSSGMGKAEIRFLNYGDFIEAMDEYLDLNEEDKLNIDRVYHQLKDKDDLIGTWKIRRYKTGMPYITFNSPESTRSILEYLINKRKNTIESMDDPLFLSNMENRFSKDGFNNLFQRINDRAGLGYAKDKNRRFFTSHTLRKFFTTTLYKNGVDKLKVDWFLGHKIDPITEAYFKNDIKSLKKSYLEILEQLSMEKVKVVTNDEYGEMKVLLSKLKDVDPDMLVEMINYFQNVKKSM